MKKFMEPELNVIKFAIEDVITTSSGDGEPVEPAPGSDNFGETDWD